MIMKKGKEKIYSINVLDPKHFNRFGMLLEDKTSRSVMMLINQKEMTAHKISIELKLDEDVVEDILKNLAEIGMKI